MMTITVIEIIIWSAHVRKHARWCYDFEKCKHCGSVKP